MRLRKKLIPGERGQALVEFSFVCVILLMLAGGVIDCVNIMRYHIALSGAATDVVTRIVTADKSAVGAICQEVIDTNFSNSLGDGNTSYSCSPGGEAKDSLTYAYHEKGKADWQGERSYIPVTVTLTRDQKLFTPFGQLIFGDSGNSGMRHMKATATTRVFADVNY